MYLLQVPGKVQWNISIRRTYCSPKQSPEDKVVSTQEKASAALKSMAELGKQWGRNSVRTMTNSVNYWWEKYEEFVGLDEVRGAQSKVTEVGYSIRPLLGWLAHEKLMLGLNLRLRKSKKYIMNFTSNVSLLF